MLPKEDLNIRKKQIGRSLRFFQEVKACPEDHSAISVQQQKDSLSLALQTKAKIYRQHPSLRPTRVRQTTLFESKEWKRLKTGKTKTAEEFAKKYGYEIIRF